MTAFALSRKYKIRNWPKTIKHKKALAFINRMDYLNHAKGRKK